MLQMPIEILEREGSFVRLLCYLHFSPCLLNPKCFALVVEEKGSGAVLRICTYRRNIYKCEGCKGAGDKKFVKLR